MKPVDHGESNDPDAPAYVTAHAYSIRHRDELARSERCGCFYCLARFAPAAITAWIIEASGGPTARRPHCGIDSVLGAASGYPITDAFLRVVQGHWF